MIKLSNYLKGSKKCVYQSLRKVWDIYNDLINTDNDRNNNK